MSNSVNHVGLVKSVLDATPEHEYGLVFGYLVVCTIDDEPYVDLQKHHAPDHVMFDAAVHFAQGSKDMNIMHEGEPVGKALFIWPMTKEIAAAFDVETSMTGLMVAAAPSSVEALEKFKSGEVRAFSLEGEGWFE